MRAAAWVLWVAGWAQSAPAAAAWVQTAPPVAPADERVAFATALRAFRSGDASARDPLLASAERMAAAGRPDARAVAEFYATLPLDARRAGLAAEARYEALFAEVAAARNRANADWPARREQIAVELDAIAAEGRAAPDPAPAARALSLAAVLDEQRARNDPALPPAQRAALLARSESNARESLALFERAHFLTPTLEPIWLLARVHDARGDLVDARMGFDDCLALAERVDSEAYRVRALRGLVTVSEQEGDLEEQRGILRELAALRAPRDDWWLARRWGALLVAEDEARAAEEFLSLHPPRDEQHVSQWHFLLGSALQRQGRVRDAEAHFALVRAVDAPGAGCVEVETAIFRAQAALERGEVDAALAIAEPLDDAACPPAARAQRAWTIGAAHLRRNDAARAENALRAALEHGRALEARLAASDDGSVFGEVVGLEAVALLADALQRQGRALEAVRVAEEVQARTLRGRGDEAVSDADVRAWAASCERGLVTWIVGADTTVCAHVAADGTAAAVAIPLGREKLHEAVRRAREAAAQGDARRAHDLAAQIEARVLPTPLAERVRGAGRLLVLAHGPLERMPFELLPLAEDGALLVLPGLAAPEPGTAPTRAETATWSVLGDPSSLEGPGVLPGARAEVDAVAALCGSAARTGDAFDRAALVDALASGRPLHVATHLVHGACDPARESGLLVARGAVLCAREIRAIAPRLPLAVLAACETAEGRYVDAQALTSVSNAFLASGTRNLCVTLWPVEDGAARRWSEAFHRALADGARPSAAARSARDALRAGGAPVSEWAAFRFAGRD